MTVAWQRTVWPRRKKSAAADSIAQHDGGRLSSDGDDDETTKLRGVASSGHMTAARIKVSTDYVNAIRRYLYNIICNVHKIYIIIFLYFCEILYGCSRRRRVIGTFEKTLTKI